MQLKQEYQLSSPAVLLPGLPPGLSTYTSASQVGCYLQAEVQWVLFIPHLSSCCAYAVLYVLFSVPYICYREAKEL